MLLPNQAKPSPRIPEAFITAPPGRVVAAATPPPPYELKPMPRSVTPGIVDPCQQMCAGNPDPGCWMACGARRSPWLY